MQLSLILSICDPRSSGKDHFAFTGKRLQNSILFESLPQPFIFAHRGASAFAPENTLAAFELAVRQDADAIELDVKLSADDHVVVIHDQTVDRTTAGSGRVGDLTLSELRALDAGSYFDHDFKGEHIPTLNEVFASIGAEILLNVELTNYASINDALPDKVAQLVKKHKIQDNVLFSSFNPVALWRTHRLIPEAPLGLLALPGRKGAFARDGLIKLLVPYQSLHIELNDISASLVNNVHQSGQKVHVYTVNSHAEMQRLFDLQVNGIFTDNVPLARQVFMAMDNSKAV